jgi:hypothetical protein
MWSEAYRVEPGERADEEVGRFADGRQLLLTARFRPALLGDTECRFVALLVFARDGSLLESQVRNLGLRSEVSDGATRSAVEAWAKELAPYELAAIEIQPFDVSVLGEDFAQLTLELEDESGSKVVVPSGAFVPGWPFTNEE